MAVLIGFTGCASQASAVEKPEEAAPSFLGEKPWTSPTKLKVRATAYKLDGKTAAGVRPRYASDKIVGSAAVPSWIPKGSLIRTKTSAGSRVYLALDHGKAVELRSAAKKSGKNAAQKRAPVIDFCAPHQAWKDQAEVEIFQYVGTTPFEKLSDQQKEATIKYASRYIRPK